ncbi:MAG: hypothetical protein RLY16_2758 [Bacteroidota bacterium]|jgi:DNA-binding NarL/FixJ family response regulator
MELKRIILADDHGFIRLGLKHILKSEFPDAYILDVADGDALVKEVTENDWDLVLTDLDMEGKNGFEALQDIRQIKPNIPVLVLSVFPEELYAVRMLKAGAAGYLNKTSSPKELIAAIHRIQIGKKYITPEIAERLIESKEDMRPHELLSNREFEIFKQIASGRTLSQIAQSLDLALSTVSTYRGRILEKLKVTTNAELTRYAIANKLTHNDYLD